MRQEIIQKLQAVNRQFYNQFAESFSRSRTLSEPGLEAIIQRIRPGARVLDLGCGQGRIARLLPEGTSYTGMDYAAGMLKEAEKLNRDLAITAQFILGDLTDEPWPSAITGTRYDWIFMRAVLHHIPAYASRSRLVQKTAECLAEDGSLILANWQFLNVKRLRKRLVPWTALHIELADIEQGDYLLDWQRDGYALRYVHLIDQAETERLAADAHLHVEQLYFADGHTNDLTLYAVLKQLAPG